MRKLPFYKQPNMKDCGPTCLRMVARYYGKSVSLEQLRIKAQYGKEGVSMLGLSEAAESIGLKSLGARLSLKQLIQDVQLPAILHWNQKHFVVLAPTSTEKKLVIADPAKGMIQLTTDHFLKHWTPVVENGEPKGLVLLLEPGISFKKQAVFEQKQKKTVNHGLLFAHVLAHKKYFFQLVLGLLLGSLLQLTFPYLTQSIVDTGINTQDIQFIQLVLIGQLMLLFSQTIVEFIRSRILLHISTRINASLLSGFWAKMLKLPLSYFDSHHAGDTIQRISDHQRIERFLTGTALNTLFSFINLFIFSLVLLNYSLVVFLIFAGGSILYLLWIRLFLRYRRQLDYERFSAAAQENTASMQLIYGIQEIKLNNAENSFRWGWESLQAALFKLNYKGLSLTQYQHLGTFFINQGKNIIITFVVAKLVIDGSLSLGMMLAIQYIIGQLNGPIEQLVSFTQQAQDAKISLERLNDIHSLEDEEPVDKPFNRSLPDEKSISIRNLSFSYPGAGNEAVLKNINLEIPEGKTTAIVGMSGSGKTTLVKLLLRFYDDYSGDIYIGAANLKNISPRFWRGVCGAVLQDSFIFNETIQKNITVSDESLDYERLIRSCKTANILSFIESLPLAFYTKLGSEGHGLSGGQKQRLAIARAVYKDPEFVFLDEATNSLDANNEKVILESLQHFFRNKTALVVAHRLSTVKNADKIVVLHNGEIVEQGGHEKLVEKKGYYYELVKNQLELGN
jgi:ATP-binding cassette, subfamily B, bacterial